MNWYYAAGGQQQGPVDDTQFETLIRSGQITPETLVWHDGLPSWQPLRQVRPAAAGSAAASAPPVIGTTPPSTSGEVICVECGKPFTRDNAIQYGTTWVCASCKPTFLQKLREGAAPGGAPYAQPSGPFDPEATLAGLRERDYSIDIGNCISRGWELVKGNFWPSVGAIALGYFCLVAASAIPCVGGIIQMLVQGPLMGGMYLFFLKQIRGEEASVGDIFSAFSIAFLQLFLVSLVSGILAGLCMMPGVVALILNEVARLNIPLPIVIVAFAAGLVPAIYLTVAWIFSIPLVIDKRMEFWPAMELSRKVVSMHWMSVFLLLLVGGLLCMAGMLALCLGFLVAAPVAMAAIAYAYEDIFSGRGQSV